MIYQKKTMSEANNFYVSSRGILKSCDWVSSAPRSSIPTLMHYPSIQSLKSIKVPILYVCSRAIIDFIQTVLPTIDFPFILVGGDCDESVPNDIFFSEDRFLTFINNPLLIHWFSQNLIMTHPKMTHIPIGLDYHTMTNNDIWGEKTSSALQETALQNICKTTKPFWERKIQCYSNFHFLMTTKHGYDRKNAMRQLNRDLVYYEPEKITRIETWNAQTNYAFVISPHGGGYDCHRLWEALVLGCIPIVKTSKIDTLYVDLPVLIVDQWSDVTEEMLQKTIASFRLRTFRFEKLSLTYWMEKIHSSKII